MKYPGRWLIGAIRKGCGALTQSKVDALARHEVTACRKARKRSTHHLHHHCSPSNGFNACALAALAQLIEYLFSVTTVSESNFCCRYVVFQSTLDDSKKALCVLLQ